MATDAKDLLDSIRAGAPSLFRLRWWAIALKGLFGVIFGILALVTPGPALLSLVLVFGIFAVADGIAGVIAAWGRARNGEAWVWFAVASVASIVLGVLAFVWPLATAFVLTLFIGANAAVTGVATLVSAVRLPADHGRGWFILAGILGLVFAGLILFNPLAGAVAITWIIGAWAFATGIVFILVGFRLRSLKARLDAGLERVRDRLAGGG